MAHKLIKFIKFLLPVSFLLLLHIFIPTSKVLAQSCNHPYCDGRFSESVCEEAQCRDCTGCLPYIGGEKPLGGFEGLGPLGTPNVTNADPGVSIFTKFLSNVVGILTIVGVIWFIFVLFEGAFKWLSSAGDKVKYQEAQKKITYGLTGLIIVISAIFIVKLVGFFFGIDILSIKGLFDRLQ